MERREHTRYGVRALVEFEWTDAGVSRSGRGLTRDISPKGMFIYSDVSPPVKADLHVEVSFQSVGATRNLRLRENGLVLRVEREKQEGFAILNRSYELLNNGNSFHV